MLLLHVMAKLLLLLLGKTLVHVQVAGIVVRHQAILNGRWHALLLVLLLL